MEAERLVVAGGVWNVGLYICPDFSLWPAPPTTRWTGQHIVRSALPLGVTSPWSDREGEVQHADLAPCLLTAELEAKANGHICSCRQCPCSTWQFEQWLRSIILYPLIIFSMRIPNKAWLEPSSEAWGITRTMKIYNRGICPAAMFGDWRRTKCFLLMLEYRCCSPM